MPLINETIQSHYIYHHDFRITIYFCIFCALLPHFPELIRVNGGKVDAFDRVLRHTIFLFLFTNYL